MKYEREINEILGYMREDWMTDEDLEDLKEITLKLTPMQQLNDEIEQGIKNGYSVEQQMILVKTALKEQIK